MFRDIVFPNGNEKEFFDMANKLGYNELVMVYPILGLPKNKLDFDGNVKVSYGILADPKKISKAKGLGKEIFVKSSNFDREVIERGSKLTIFGLETRGKRDFIHQRNSGLNQVLCKFAKQNEINYGLPFSDILNSGYSDKIIGRVKQNIKLCKKYGVKVVFGSFASDPYEMRGAYDLKAFFGLI